MNHLFIALSPLYRLDVAAVGKGKPARRFYALDEKERDALLEKLRREGVQTSKIDVGRFKGLGEMNATQLKETSMDPATRRVLPVRYNPDDAKEVNAIFELLMGESGAASRREWMARKGSTVEADA
jgi:topoisomerase-4 subunit B